METIIYGNWDLVEIDDRRSPKGQCNFFSEIFCEKKARKKNLKKNLFRRGQKQS